MIHAKDTLGYALSEVERYLHNTTVQSPSSQDLQHQQFLLAQLTAHTCVNLHVMKWTTAAVEDKMIVQKTYPDVATFLK